MSNDNEISDDRLTRAATSSYVRRLAELVERLQSDLLTRTSNFCTLAKQLEEVAGERDGLAKEVYRVREELDYPARLSALNKENAESARVYKLERDSAITERDASRAEVERMRQHNINEVGALWAHQAEVEVERDALRAEVATLRDHLRVSEEQNDALGAVNEAQVEVERMRPVFEAALALDSSDYSAAHNRGCGQSSMSECVACRFDRAVASALAGQSGGEK